VRWITAERALKDHSLRQIAADKTPVSSSITVSELRHVAFDRLYSAKVSNSEMPPSATAELFLNYSHLSPKDSTAVTLGSLDLKGTWEDPLDVFVVPIRMLGDKLQDTWGFTSSDRGIVTFLTCLKLFIKRVAGNSTNLNNALKALWEVTHFPPAAIALKQLCEHGIKPFPCAVFACCFRDASFQTVPPWISPQPDSVLEASRQIFSWLHSIGFQSSKQLGADQALVHQVELREVDTQEDENRPGRYSYDELVHVPVLDLAGCSDISIARSSSRKVLASKERLDSVPHKDLALALSGVYEMPCNFYFNLPLSVGPLREHRRRSMPHISDFDEILQATNQHDFKIVSPLQLTQYTGAALPVITLDKEAYVSLYDQKYEECGDTYFFTYNAIKGEEKMPTCEPGQFLLQKLQPIITQRKKEGSWETDAWTEDGISGIERPPDETIAICIDRSWSMRMPMDDGWLDGNGAAIGDLKSRLSEVKDVFKNLVTRLNAYKLNTHLGLITFAGQTDVQVNQPLAQTILDFRDKLEDIVPNGSTALWDALVKAKEMLTAYKLKFPGTRLRIIALTDGENNDSRFQAPYVCRELYDNNIVLDAIVIGTTATSDLFKIAKHTGGYAFVPKLRTALYQIFLLETFIDIRTRPDIVKVPIKNYAISTPKRTDMEDIYDFPPCRPHENLNDHFIALGEAGRFLAAVSRRSSRPISLISSRSTVSGASFSDNASTIGPTITSGASGSARILLNEVRAMIDNPHPHMDVYVSESNMGFWKIVMQGPPSSPYESGIFLLYVELGNDFPRVPPTARFITPILHPNISKVRLLTAIP
jgi:uncharacterized protein YegL